ncbi:GLPGLI family protein [Anditalea andensis]|uniref:GLPGLI family protein n=1 Tax=Anditalea andensis TaxID=1048983 RepID=A0A074LM44_9BACT|nr:GLPGLI family protein [Anditalea andensis]KEO74957.1 hypothetical protein EL17_04575 [Anditalea andensis]
MKIFNTIILFFITLHILYAQNSKELSSNLAVFYEMNYIPDLSQLDEVKKTLTILLIRDQSSLFKTYNKYRQDSLVNHHSSIGTSFNEFNEIKKQIPSSSHNFQIVKEKKFITIYDKVIPDQYMYERNSIDIQWEILGEKQELFGFQVQKASTVYGGRKWEAWFTEEIPLNEGPYIFNGLPGLIITIEDSEGHYKFSLFKIKNDIKIPLTPYLVKKPIKTNEKDFLKLRKEFYLNASQKLAQTNMNINDKEIANAVDVRYRKKLNFIEREH